MLTVDARCSACPHVMSIYRMVGYCLNCKADPVLILLSHGHEASNRTRCPVCGTDNVRPQRLATDDEIPAADSPTTEAEA